MDESDRTNAEGRALAPKAPNRDPEPHHATGRDVARINLARELRIGLGALSIEPALRRVAHADGREEIVEPRVMQVFVALIRADGRIVSRDDLLLSCWHGVVVGEDAINRVMGRVRRLADGIGGGAFKLETITKVGYRLVPADSRAEIVPSPPPPDAEPPAPVAAEPLLAVLAFDNLCEGEDMAWFSDGVSEEIQQTVARGADLKVIGRTSSFQFRGPEKVVGRVAAELGATHVLDGSVRRSGSRVRISAQLIECAGQTTLWADRFDGDLTDIFALQDEIAAVVAKALLHTFSPSAGPKKIDPEAYDLYLRARALGGAQPTIVDEVRLLEQAVSLDADFSAAWARLAVAKTMEARWFSTAENYAARRDDAIVALDRASVLDPAGATTLLARALLEPQRHFAVRETLLDRALSSAPSDPDVLRHASNFAGSVGRFREAYRLTALASQIDPLNQAVAVNTAGTLAEVDLIPESYQAFEAARNRWPSYDAPVVLPLLMAAHFRDWKTAQPLIEIAKAREGRGFRQALSTVQLYKAPIQETRERLRGVVERHLAATGSVDLPTILFMHSVGLTEEAFEAVARSSFDDRRGSLERTFMIDIIFGVTNSAMRLDPRFVQLCGALGLCDYWVSTDRWPDCAEAVAPCYDFKAETRRLVAG